jgi:UDP-glucose 4-epimerase
MTVVAVTGASGYLGRRVVEALDGREDVRRVVGIDVSEPGYATRNLEFYRLDVRSPALRDVLRGCDVLVHLAFVLTTMRDEEEMRDINVGGTHNAIAAAAEAGVRKLIYTSSVMAYGAHPDNDFPLTEESSIRGLRDFAYSAHKAEIEGVLEGFVQSHADVTVTIVRPALVLGPNASGVVARVVESPWLMGIEGYGPAMQFVHESDVVRAILFAIERDVPGAYNVAPDGWLTQERVAELLGKRRMVLDYESAYRRTERLWRVGLAELPPAYLPFLMYPWVMSNQKLRDAGFTFEYSNEAALLAAAEARRGWVSVGRVRFRPRNLVAMAGAALLAGSVVRRQVRRRLPGA